MSEDNHATAYMDVDDCPGYRVGDDGSVWTSRIHSGNPNGEWKRLKTFLAGRGGGHHAIKLSQNGKKVSRYVHQLVLTAFVGPRPYGLEGCHNDGNRDNNTIGNLRWGTPESNTQDRQRHGTTQRGEKHYMNVLTESAVKEIAALLATGDLTPTDIAPMFGVTQGTIRAIAIGKTWGWLLNPMREEQPQ